MSTEGLRQAAQVLRSYLATMGAPDQDQQLSVIASLIYADRLNDPPIYPGDPQAVDAVCDRFGRIITDHVDLAALLMNATASMLGTSAPQLLDDIVSQNLGGYS